MENNIRVMGFIKSVGNIAELMKKLDAISGDCVIQLLNADGIAGEEHVIHATLQAISSFKRKDNIANDLGLEICVRASGQRQISKAINILGLKEGLNNICAVMVDCNDQAIECLERLLGKRDDTILKPDENGLKDIYHITDEEIKTSGNIARALMERTTILVLET